MFLFFDKDERTICKRPIRRIPCLSGGMSEIRLNPVDIYNLLALMPMVEGIIFP